MRQVVLDTETTGLDIANDHRIIEIAGVELVNRKLTKNSYQVYLNPERTVGPSFKIHGLSDDFLSDKPSFKEIYEEFLDFIKDSELLIHNAEFDVGFLNHELKLADLDIKIEVLEEQLENIKKRQGINFEKIGGVKNPVINQESKEIDKSSEDRPIKKDPPTFSDTDNVIFKIAGALILAGFLFGLFSSL